MNIIVVPLPSTCLVPPPPSEVGVSNISFSTATVCWKALTQNSVSEYIITYAPTTRYYAHTLNISAITVVIPFELGEQLYCVTLNRLEENARYKVLVTAANSVGKSASIGRKFRTAIHGESTHICTSHVKGSCTTEFTLTARLH